MQHSAVVFGTDDRHEVNAESDANVAALATSTAAALINPIQLRFSGDEVSVRAAPLSAWDDYCNGTSFLNQPTAAVCSAVLIDDDLLLTAGHCLETVPSCRDYAYVFDYSYPTETVLGPITRADVYSCRVVAVHESSPPDSATQIDFAVVQLDRPVVGRTPAALTGSQALATGDDVTVIGCPSGLPVKIDGGAGVVDSRTSSRDFFTMTSDTFRASSGSGVYSRGALVGVFARGTADFVDEGTCSAERVIADSSASGESATYAARAIEALCASGWPSERLCGNVASCGDGVCSAAAAETNASCSVDCATTVCSDGLCERDEWESCPADCGDRRPAGLPDSWYCEPVWYGDGETCDCNCGALDADCASRHQSACDSVGPAGLEPERPGLTVHGGCSFVVARVPTTESAAALLGTIAALLLRRRRQPVMWRALGMSRLPLGPAV